MSVTPPSQFDQIGFGVSAFVEMLKNVCEIAAIGVGAIWTYFNFFKGRTYKSRLECEVDGSLEASSGRLLLKVVVTAKKERSYNSTRPSFTTPARRGLARSDGPISLRFSTYLQSTPGLNRQSRFKIRYWLNSRTTALLLTD